MSPSFPSVPSFSAALEPVSVAVWRPSWSRTKSSPAPPSAPTIRDDELASKRSTSRFVPPSSRKTTTSPSWPSIDTTVSPSAAATVIVPVAPSIVTRAPFAASATTMRPSWPLPPTVRSPVSPSSWSVALLDASSIRTSPLN
jgi:hypothetical protein